MWTSFLHTPRSKLLIWVALWMIYTWTQARACLSAFLKPIGQPDVPSGDISGPPACLLRTLIEMGCTPTMLTLWQKAAGLQAAIANFNFITTCVTVSKGMALIQILTRSLKLQERLWISAAPMRKSTVCEEGLLKVCRDNINEKFEHWWVEVEELAEQSGVHPSVSCRCHHQNPWENMPADTQKVYYRRVVALHLLDDILAQFRECFSPLRPRSKVFALCQVSLFTALPSDQSCNSSSPEPAQTLARNSVCPCISSLLLACIWSVSEGERSVSSLGRIKGQHFVPPWVKIG